MTRHRLGAGAGVDRGRAGAARGSGGWIWWGSGCHDGFCTGSTHRVSLTVRGPGAPPDCWNDIEDLKLGGRYWESHDHAPDAWGRDPSPERSG